MKSQTFARSLVLLTLALIGLWAQIPGVQAAPSYTQNLTLFPGWNSIHLQVDPVNADPSVVFAGLDIDSVWTYENRLGQPEFVQEVTEARLLKAGWFSWVPTTREDAFQNTLFQLIGQRAYLVKFNGTGPVVVSISGQPRLRNQGWQSDAYNFRGLPVDASIPPTFQSFFQPSPAHYTSANGLQPMYRMDLSGQWVRIVGSDLIEEGKAYWIYCKGGSDFVAPLKLQLSAAGELDYDTTASELPLTVRNLRSVPVNVTVVESSGLNLPLAAEERDADLRRIWQDLPAPWVKSLAAGATRTENLALRRELMVSDELDRVLEISDGLGSRFLVPVMANRVAVEVVASPNRSTRRSSAAPAAAAETLTHVGLWMGTITIGAVSEAHSGPLTTNVTQGFTVQEERNIVTGEVTTQRIPNSVVRESVSLAPTPTRGEFNLRLLLHVDSSGQTRLLKEVIQMYQEAATTIDGSGNTVVTRPGRSVLLTDDSLISSFSGVTQRDGVSVGRRLSTVDFDFPDNDLPLQGDLAVGFTLIGTNKMSATFARNPFKHRYHPDHSKGYDIQRVLELTLSPAPANPPPGYGERILHGTYTETITGLHRTNIVVAGTFRLNRLETTGLLNPQP